MRRVSGRGQAMVLMMLTMLLLVLMVCMTLGIASRAKERANLQTVADAVAYSNAIATARTYNTAAVLNRAMIAHYAAMTAIQAEAAWVTSPMRILDEAAGLTREMEIPNPSKLPGCPPYSHPGDPYWNECGPFWRIDEDTTCRSDAIRPASYELWHAALSNYHPNPKYPGDSVNGKCANGVPLAANGCSAPRNFLGPKGFPELDQEVADQQRDIHDAIYDLARIQSATWTKLKNDIQNNKLANAIIKREEGGGVSGLGPFSSHAQAIAYNEVNAATDVMQSHGIAYNDTMGQAVMGARISSLALEHDRDVFTKRMTQLLGGVNANIGSLAGNWNVTVASQPDARGMVSPSVNVDDTSNQENKGFDPTMRVIYGDFVVKLTVSWTLPCGPNAGTRRTVPRVVRTVVGATEGPAWHFLHDGGGHKGPSGSTWNACHINHAHYGENDESIHRLNHELLPQDALGYVFPLVGQNKGAVGIWGMPKMPVMLTQKSDAKKPWELDFKFQLNKSSSGQKLDLRDGISGELPKLAAYSAGVAYYHRRGHVAEPPNMLNPYWRATLVPAEIDEHTKSGGDFSPGSGPNARRTDGSNGPLKYDPIAKDAYIKLRAVLKPLEGPG